MRFIHAWSYCSANYLTKQLNENHEKRRIYYFGFQVVLGLVLKIASLIIISLIFGFLIPTMVMLLIFATLRSIAGGYHMDTVGKCYVVTVILFVLAGSTVQYTYTMWALEYVILFISISFLAALFIVIRWAPSDTPNKPITKPEEIRKFKTLSILYVVLWLCVITTLFLFNQYIYVLSGCFGLILESFMITPLAYRMFDKVSRKVDEISS